MTPKLSARLNARGYAVVTVNSLTYFSPRRTPQEVARLIVRSALHRKESRGLHYTTDYPMTLPQAVDTVLVP